MAWMWVEIREEWWIDTALPQAHWSQTVQMCRMREIVCTKWSSGAAHEASHAEKQMKINQLISLCFVEPSENFCIPIVIWRLCARNKLSYRNNCVLPLSNINWCLFYSSDIIEYQMNLKNDSSNKKESVKNEIFSRINKHKESTSFF